MPSLSLAAKFPRRHQAEAAYTEIVALLAPGSPELSLFRLESDGSPYVVLVGEEVDLNVWQHLAGRLQKQGGKIVVLDDTTIDGLLAKRQGAE